MNIITIHSHYRKNAWFPEVGIILTMLPFILLILNGVGALYRNFTRSYFFYLVTTSVYTIAWLLRDYWFLYTRPIPQIIQCDHAKLFDVSAYGFPDAGMSFIVSVLLSNVALFGSLKNQLRVIITNFILLCLLTFAYFYADLLYFYQIVGTYLFATILTYFGMFLARVCEECLCIKSIQSRESLLE